MVRKSGMRVLFGLLAVVVTLSIGGVVYRVTTSLEAAAPPAAAMPPVERPKPELRALLPDEEAFAVALWSVHSQVKLAAIRMTFAGINHKVHATDRAELRVAVTPVLALLTRSEAAARAMEVPPSMQALHAKYLGAIGLYRSAAEEMLAGLAPGAGDRLLVGQGLSFRASEEVLRVGDQLWPTEHKPH